MPRTMVRFNLAGAPDIADRTRLHATMLDLAATADSGGVEELSFNEHHATADGSATSPLLLAAMALARTRRIRVSVSALLLPLHDPVGVAEDVATLDVAFPGRLRVTVALGYRPEEYERFGRDFAQRGALMDEALSTVLETWAGARGDGGARPRSAPADLLAVGGERPVAARRAARNGVAFAPRAHLPDLLAEYESACREAGTTPTVWMPAPRFVQVHVAEDPEAAWPVVGPHYLADAAGYASWQRGGVRSPVYSAAASIDELRSTGVVRVLTPDEAVDLAVDPDVTLCLHPLAGAMPDAEARRSVDLFCDRVVPRLLAPGASTPEGTRQR